MRWLDRVKGLFRTEQRSITLADFPQLLLNPPTAAGVAVTEATAYNFSAYFNGVDIISSQIASLPRIVYRRGANDSRERVDGSPAARVLSQPNPDMTDIVFWQTLMGHVLTWGNAYAEIEFDRAMRPIGLWPISPALVEPIIDGGRLAYRFMGARIMPGEDVLHLAGLGFDGRRGYSVVQMARQTLGLGLAAERFGGAFFGNGAWPGFLLEHPGKISAEAAGRLQKSWDDLRRGPDRAYQTAVLEEGMKANKLGIPPDDAQFLQTREFQVVEIARWLNLPPHKLKHKVGERPGGNIEASQIEFLTDTLRPWLVRIEQECNRKLLSRADRQTLYVEHLVDSILRMDGTARATSYKTYLEMGVLTAAQIAQKENLPVPEERAAPIGSRIENVGRLIQAGFDPVESLTALGLPPIKHLGVLPVTVQPVDVPGPPPNGPPAGRMASALRSAAVDVVGRFVRIESERIRRQTKKGAQGLDAWLETFYAGQTPVLRAYLMGPVRIAMAAAGVDGDPGLVAGELAEAYVQQSREELMALPSRNLEEAAERLLAGWETSRPIDMAERLLAVDLRRAVSVAAPVVNVTVNVPEGPAPTVQNIVNVPAAPAPEVRVDAPVTVNVPPARAAEVVVNNLPAPRVTVENTVNVPSPAPLRVERDAAGNISGVRPA